MTVFVLDYRSILLIKVRKAFQFKLLYALSSWFGVRIFMRWLQFLSTFEISYIQKVFKLDITLYMEHEVSAHTKKIYRTMKNSKLGLGEKIKGILIEIFIIVFAVTLSIWFHSWSEHSHEQKEVKEFLQGIRNDLTDDIQQLNTNKNVVTRLQSNYKKILLPEKGNKTDIDSLIVHFEVDLRVTRPNIGRYEGFKSSGKIGTIENDSLKEMILVFYEQTINELVYGENFVNDLQIKIQELSFEKGDKISRLQFAEAHKTKALMWLTANNFNGNMRAYNKAADDAKKIIDEIDHELK